MCRREVPVRYLEEVMDLILLSSCFSCSSEGAAIGDIGGGDNDNYNGGLRGAVIME